MNKKSLAFSLIELLIVIAIMGILSFIAIPTYTKYLTKAKIAKFFSLADQYKSQLLDQIINQEKLNQNSTNIIFNPNDLFEKVEYLESDHKKYTLKLTANMHNLGIKLINNVPLTVQFIAQEDQINNLITWSCHSNSEYSELIYKHCKIIS